MKALGKKTEQTSAPVSIFVWMAVAFFLATVETAWANPFGQVVCSPAPLLVFCICLGLYAPPDRALIWGAMCGVCSDLAKGGVGFDCLLYLYISAGCVWLGKRFYFRRSHEGMAVAFFVVWLYGVAASLIGGSGFYLLSVVSAGINALFVPVFRGLIRRKEV